MKSHPAGRPAPQTRVAPGSRQINTKAPRPVEFRVRPPETTRCTHHHCRVHDAWLRSAPDPVDLALQYSQDLSEDEVLAAFADRRAALQVELTSWRHLQETAAPYLHGAEPLCLEHQLIRLEAELTWHDMVIAELPKLLSAGPTSPE
jgi:hypothetical protein